MQPSFLSFWRGAALALAFVMGFLATPAMADDDEKLGQPAGSLGVPEGMTNSEIKDVVVSALINRGWMVKKKTEETVVGYLKHRANEATVTFEISPEQINMYCVGYAVSKKTGERIKPEQPNGWLGNLRKDITRGLNRAYSLK